jgi:glycosyl transferase family 87
LSPWLVRRLLVGWVMFGGIFVVFGVIFWLQLGITGRLQGLDFMSFYATSKVLLTQGPAHVYELAAQQQAQAALLPGSRPFLPDLYPPYWVLVRSWLALLPLSWAYLAWGVLTIAASAASLFLLARTAAFESWRSWPMLTAAGFAPLVVNLVQGQSVAFVLLGIALSLWFHNRGREIAAGAALSLLLIKPQVGILLLGLLLIRPSARALAGFAIAAAALLAAGLAVFDTGGVAAWLRLLTEDGGTFFRPWLSLRSPLVAAGLAGWEQYLVLAALAAGLLALIVVARLDLKQSFVVATAGSLLVAPHVNVHDLSLLLVPGLLLISARQGRSVVAVAYFSAVAAIWFAPAAWLADLVLIWLAFQRSGKAAEAIPGLRPSAGVPGSAC